MFSKKYACNEFCSKNEGLFLKPKKVFDGKPDWLEGYAVMVQHEYDQNYYYQGDNNTGTLLFVDCFHMLLF